MTDTDIDRLRELVELGYVESMNLLAVLLGDIDSRAYRER